MPLPNGRSRRWVEMHFGDPQKLVPGSVMPAYKLPAQDMENLTSYLFACPNSSPGRPSPDSIRRWCGRCLKSAIRRIPPMRPPGRSAPCSSPRARIRQRLEKLHSDLNGEFETLTPAPLSEIHLRESV